MKSKKKLFIRSLPAFVMIIALIYIGNVLSNAENPQWAKVVFFVS